MVRFLSHSIAAVLVRLQALGISSLASVDGEQNKYNMWNVWNALRSWSQAASSL